MIYPAATNCHGGDAATKLGGLAFNFQSTTTLSRPGGGRNIYCTTQQHITRGSACDSYDMSNPRPQMSMLRCNLNSFRVGGVFLTCSTLKCGEGVFASQAMSGQCVACHDVSVQYLFLPPSGCDRVAVLGNLKSETLAVRMTLRHLIVVSFSNVLMKLE
jgi:hypothetical protein